MISTARNLYLFGIILLLAAPFKLSSSQVDDFIIKATDVTRKKHQDEMVNLYFQLESLNSVDSKSKEILSICKNQCTPVTFNKEMDSPRTLSDAEITARDIERGTLPVIKNRIFTHYNFTAGKNEIFPVDDNGKYLSDFIDVPHSIYMRNGVGTKRPYQLDEYFYQLTYLGMEKALDLKKNYVELYSFVLTDLVRAIEAWLKIEKFYNDNSDLEDEYWSKSSIANDFIARNTKARTDYSPFFKYNLLATASLKSGKNKFIAPGGDYGITHPLDKSVYNYVFNRFNPYIDINNTVSVTFPVNDEIDLEWQNYAQHMSYFHAGIKMLQDVSGVYKTDLSIELSELSNFSPLGDSSAENMLNRVKTLVTDKYLDQESKITESVVKGGPSLMRAYIVSQMAERAWNESRGLRAFNYVKNNKKEMLEEKLKKCTKEMESTFRESLRTMLKSVTVKLHDIITLTKLGNDQESTHKLRKEFKEEAEKRFNNENVSGVYK